MSESALCSWEEFTSQHQRVLSNMDFVTESTERLTQSDPASYTLSQLETLLQAAEKVNAVTG